MGRMGRLTIHQTLDSPHPNHRRNPNPNLNRVTKPPPNPLVMGQVKLLRRGEPLTAFEERETTATATYPASTDLKKNKKNKSVRFCDGADVVDLYSTTGGIGTEPTGTASAAAVDIKKKRNNNKKMNKKVVRFSGGDDVEMYSTTCRIGPEPDMVPTGIGLFGGYGVESPPASSLPLPLSLLRLRA